MAFYPSPHTSETILLVPGYHIAGQTQYTSISKYGGNFYLAMWNNGCIRCIELSSNLNVSRNVDVGQSTVTDDHYRPSIAVTTRGIINIVSGYNGDVKSWWANVTDMVFNEVRHRESFCYPVMYPTLDGKYFMIARGDYSLIILSDSHYPAGVWQTKSTIWTWGEGLQDVCYYHSADYQNGRLYVAAAGPRGNITQLEKRDGIWFAYTDDLGDTWHSTNGSAIVQPEKIYNGYVSRVSISVTNGEVLILYSLCVNAEQYSEYGLLYLRARTGEWEHFPIPKEGHAAGALGQKAARVINNQVHVFVSFQQSYGQYSTGKATHLWATLPSILGGDLVWKSENLTAGFNCCRDITTELDSGNLVVFFAKTKTELVGEVYEENGSDEYVWKTHV